MSEKFFWGTVKAAVTPNTAKNKRDAKIRPMFFFHFI